jgi:hypothetical protein
MVEGASLLLPTGGSGGTPSNSLTITIERAELTSGTVFDRKTG